MEATAIQSIIEQGNSLSINFMRQQNYPGSELKIEQKLESGSNYDQYIASYFSENLKIYGLLTIPQGKKPVNGWPVIIMNHGYIPPQEYKTTGFYIPYVRAMARSGYIVFEPDFRGHDKSQGLPGSQYFSPSYTIDLLNALATLKKFPQANPNKIGMWGHSDGGDNILKSIVINTKDIKAAVIWGGVVAPYTELTTNWQRRVTYHQPQSDLELENNHLADLITAFNTPEKNPAFWDTIEPFNFLLDINTPVQLHTGESDEQVPPDFSSNLKDKLVALGKTAEYYNYPKGDHNISSPSFHTAMLRTIAFFDKYLK